MLCAKNRQNRQMVHKVISKMKVARFLLKHVVISVIMLSLIAEYFNCMLTVVINLNAYLTAADCS